MTLLMKVRHAAPTSSPFTPTAELPKSFQGEPVGTVSQGDDALQKARIENVITPRGALGARLGL